MLRLDIVRLVLVDYDLTKNEYEYAGKSGFLHEFRNIQKPVGMIKPIYFRR